MYIYILYESRKIKICDLEDFWSDIKPRNNFKLFFQMSLNKQINQLFVKDNQSISFSFSKQIKA
ncbi:hypothetical protein BpHYR1_009589 [Brachionus plicatilis]|uniref:Uncharacterized protein n=1 Tax=Brachionus plicatilis TaxID=10195 RepID=A0A3M7QAX6_BRAPC|nr:hypothetical protein BpHYR1_009589 [Brachionus plicatilis]